MQIYCKCINSNMQLQLFMICVHVFFLRWKPHEVSNLLRRSLEPWPSERTLAFAAQALNQTICDHPAISAVKDSCLGARQVVWSEKGFNEANPWICAHQNDGWWDENMSQFRWLPNHSLPQKINTQQNHWFGAFKDGFVRFILRGLDDRCD